VSGAHERGARCRPSSALSGSSSSPLQGAARELSGRGSAPEAVVAEVVAAEVVAVAEGAVEAAADPVEARTPGT